MADKPLILGNVDLNIQVNDVEITLSVMVTAKSPAELKSLLFKQLDTAGLPERYEQTTDLAIDSVTVRPATATPRSKIVDPAIAKAEAAFMASLQPTAAAGSADPY